MPWQSTVDRFMTHSSRIETGLAKNSLLPNEGNIVWMMNIRSWVIEHIFSSQDCNLLPIHASSHSPLPSGVALGRINIRPVCPPLFHQRSQFNFELISSSFSPASLYRLCKSVPKPTNYRPGHSLASPSALLTLWRPPFGIVTARTRPPTNVAQISRELLAIAQACFLII